MTACFPVAHPLPSLWLEGNPFEDYRSTPELPTHADIVVVGTGLSGSSTVLELSKTPNLSVLVLEARGASSGATGRNGGHLTPLSFRDYRLDCQLHGQAYALAVRDFEMQNYQELRTLIDTEDIQCHFQNDSGNVQLYCDVDAYQEALEDLRVWKADGGNAAGVQVLDAEKAKQMSPLAVGAIRIPASQLTPPVFCWHILQQALRNPKINLQTHTPVTGIDPVNHSETCGPWTIKTPRGTVTASKVILCTNGWSRHFNLVDIVPVRAQVTAYQNLPEIEQHEHFGFSAHHGAEYMHERAFDHTVVLGGARDKVPGQEIGVWNDAEINPRVAQGLDDYLASHFPRMCQRSSSLLLPVRKRWTGIMGYTASGRPYIGETKNESNVYICAGFNGHGMPWCFQSGRRVARLAIGSPKEALSKEEDVVWSCCVPTAHPSNANPVHMFVDRMGQCPCQVSQMSRYRWEPLLAVPVTICVIVCWMYFTCATQNFR